MNSQSSGQRKSDAETFYFHPPSPFHGIFCNCNSIDICIVLLRSSSFNFHCYTQREATPIQKSARKCAATSCDFFAERLQSAFTLANQLHWIAQYCPSITYNRNIGKWNMWKNAGSWGLYYWILTMSHSLIQWFTVCESEQKYFCSCLKCSLIINSYSNK